MLWAIATIKKANAEINAILVARVRRVSASRSASLRFGAWIMTVWDSPSCARMLPLETDFFGASLLFFVAMMCGLFDNLIGII
jgi:hypothetical protein